MNVQQRICLITGGTSGLGKAAAVALARQGFQILIAARNAARGAQATEEIKRQSANPAITFLQADLSTLNGIQSLSQAVHSQVAHLDVLMNNAGTMQRQRILTSDGLELHFALHAVAPTLLSLALRDLLAASELRRIVNVNSLTHYLGTIDVENLHGERHYNGWNAYASSKLAMTGLTTELALRFAGDRITANSVHPGMVATGISREGPFLLRLLMHRWSPLFTNPERGARGQVFLASSPTVAGVTGAYFMGTRRWPQSTKVRDQVLREQLWNIVCAYQR